MATLGKLAETVIKDASTERGKLPELWETAKGNPGLQILAEKGDLFVFPKIFYKILHQSQIDKREKEEFWLCSKTKKPIARVKMKSWSERIWYQPAQ